jgi:hypothetical protein
MVSSTGADFSSPTNGREDDARGVGVLVFLSWEGFVLFPSPLPLAARAYRAPSGARVHRALVLSSGPPFEKTSKKLLLGGLHLLRRCGVRLRSCLALQVLDRDMGLQVSG